MDKEEVPRWILPRNTVSERKFKRFIVLSVYSGSTTPYLGTWVVWVSISLKLNVPWWIRTSVGCPNVVCNMCNQY
jgi:hypothetical protein